MGYQFDVGVLWEYRWALARGLATTLLLSVAAIVTATLIALPGTMALVSRWGPVRWMANAWVQVTRAIPLLVLLVGAYYVAPTTIGIRPAPFATAWLVFSLYLAAFVADILRSCVLAVPREHREAALAIGMSAAQVRWRVVVPGCLRLAMPALTALFIGLLKYSTLASVVGVDELMRTAELIMLRRLRPLEAYAAVALLFVIVVVPAGLLGRWLEGRHLVDRDPGRVF